MSKVLVLSGGGEFADASQPLDRAALALTKISYPTLVIVPAAAAAHAKRTVRSGMWYFKGLGAEPHYTMVVDEETAESGDKAVSLENADAIYLTDGSPLDAVTAMKDSSVLRIIVRSWERGAMLEACGASAMALCESYWDGGVWEPGLGVIKHLAVIPHHQLMAGRFSYARLREGLPETHQIIGIDDSTGVIMKDDGSAKVVGSGFVTLYGEEEKDYETGEVFPLKFS